MFCTRGKALVRTVAEGQGYRIADLEQPIFELDPEAEATRPKHA
jgi:hypothetical protein